MKPLKLDSKYVLFELEGDDLLIATYKKDVDIIDREMSVEIVAARVAFQGHRKLVRLLVKAPGAIQMTKGAREYMSSKEGIKGLAATAIVVEQNPVTRLLSNWILRVQQPSMKVRICNSEAKARAWLNTQRITSKPYATSAAT